MNSKRNIHATHRNEGGKKKHKKQIQREQKVKQRLKS